MVGDVGALKEAHSRAAFAHDEGLWVIIHVLVAMVKEQEDAQAYEDYSKDEGHLMVHGGKEVCSPHIYAEAKVGGHALWVACHDAWTYIKPLLMHLSIFHVFIWD